MSITPMFGERLINVELTLQPTYRTHVRDIDDASSTIPVNYVRRVRSLTEPVESAADPRYTMHGTETTENVGLSEANAQRLVEAFRQLHYLERYDWEDQWIFRYVAGDINSPNTPFRVRKHPPIIDLEGPVTDPEPNRLYAISRGIEKTVFKTFLTLDNPERGLTVSGGEWHVANTRDLAKLGRHLTTAHIPVRPPKKR